MLNSCGSHETLIPTERFELSVLSERALHFQHWLEQGSSNERWRDQSAAPCCRVVSYTGSKDKDIGEYTHESAFDGICIRSGDIAGHIQLWGVKVCSQSEGFIAFRAHECLVTTCGLACGNIIVPKTAQVLNEQLALACRLSDRGIAI
jgi:hypothetical protein